MKLTFRAALVALAALMPLAAVAQTVVQVPQNVNTRTLADLGNGPTEIRMLQGNMAVFTQQSSGVGQTLNGGSATLLTLTATPTTLPCVGCAISGTGITAGTTLTAVNASALTLSAAMSVATATTVSWGAACPTVAPPTVGIVLIQAAVGSDLPMYTYARVCAYGGNGPGGLFTQFAIGAH